MKSVHLVDPELRAALASMPELDLSVAALPAIRAAIAARFPGGETHPDVHVEEVCIERGDVAPLRVVLYQPRVVKGLRAAILHLHGGGFVLGSTQLNHRENLEIAAELGCVVCSIDYRLAPETVYPGQLEDARTALSWLRASSEGLSVEPSRIAVKGESAGGGLAVALALSVRDNRERALAFLALTFPALDDRTGSGSPPHPYCGEFLWTAARNRFGWTALLGRPPGDAEVPCLAAPARAEDLTGLPPIFIAVGSLDLYLEENLEFARRLARAGVAVDLRVYSGAVHSFGMVPGSRLDRRSRADLRDALKQGLV